MSSLDPLIASGKNAAAFEKLASLVVGPKPAAVNLTIAVNPPGSAQRVVLDITRAGEKPKKAEKKEKAPKEKAPPAAAATKPAAAAAAPPPAKKPSAAGVSVGAVPASEPAKLDAATIASCQVAQDVSPTQARLQAEVAKLGITTSKFWRVRSDYYDQALEWRRDVLGAASTTQLCKSMIMENTKVGDLSFEEVMSKGRVKYVCVVLQYAGAKLNKEKLTDAFRAMEGERRARTHAAADAQKWHAHPLRSQLTCSRPHFSQVRTRSVRSSIRSGWSHRRPRMPSPALSTTR